MYYPSLLHILVLYIMPIVIMVLPQLVIVALRREIVVDPIPMTGVEPMSRDPTPTETKAQDPWQRQRRFPRPSDMRTPW